jgi:HEAT repeat protein
MKSSIIHPAAAIALLLIVPSPLPAQDEAAQLELLKKPDATLAQKQDACRNLAIVGTAKSVPALAGLLGDAGLSHMARLALEPIPDPAVDAALRDALGKVTGSPQLGVIGSIGVRGDQQAIPALTKLLTASDPAVAAAAARALGEIGTVDAAKSLEAGLKGASPGQFQAVCEGLLRCAESLTKKEQQKDALAVYTLLGGIPQAPHQIRTAALRGAVLAQGKAGLPLLMEALRGDDWGRFFSAVRISTELKGPEVAQALAGELGKLPAERRILIVQTLGQRGDAVIAPALLPLLESAEIPVRIEAAKALTRLAHVPVVPVLSKLALTAEGGLATAAKDCLASFPGEAADTAITALIQNPDAGVRRIGIEMVGRRSTKIAVPTLLKIAATDREETVRVAAIEALRELAGIGELGALLQILLESDSAKVTQSVRHALVVLCVRQKPAKSEPPPAACVDPLVAALGKSSGPAREALLEVLRRVGGPKAEEALRNATGKDTK